ncbi:MAG: hypothetical protein VYA84_21730 [Planctomycetota bacterium]|nr:hypothetical protein [Planctomycetota bacterium]
MAFLKTARHRFAVAALAAVTFATATAPQALAQDDGGASEPVVVMTFGSINKLMQDVNYMSSAMGQPQAGGIFTMMAGTFTQGIDTTQPIGMLVPLVDGAPQPIALLPTADVKTVLKRLEAQVGPADELDDGTLVVLLGASAIYIRQSGNWAVLAPSQDLLDLAPANPEALFEGMGNAYDMAVSLKMQQVPTELRTMITEQIRQGFEQAMAMQQGADADGARDMAESSIEQLEQLINETDEMSFGINIDPSAKNMAMDMSFTAVPGSEMAAMYGSQRSVPSQFSSVIRDDAAAYFHSSTSVPPEAVEQARASISNSLMAVRQALADNNLSPAQQDEITAMIDRIIDLGLKSMSEGRSDLGLVVLADQTQFRFALGTFVADGNEAAEIVKDLAAKIENEPNAPRFKFDIGTYKGVTMHMVEADVPASAGEAREMFGEVLQVHVGTGEKAVYLAAGNDGEALMKEMIDAAGSDSSADRPASQFRMKLLPMLQYAQTIEANDTVATLIEALTRSPNGGEMTVVEEGLANGQKIQITIGEGLMKALGVAATQAQQQMQGQF